MKKKLTIFALLFALMLSVMEVRTVRADNTGMFETWCEEKGLPTVFDVETQGEEIQYVVGYDATQSNLYHVLRIYASDDVKVYSDTVATHIRGAQHTYDLTWARTNRDEWGGCTRTTVAEEESVLKVSGYNLVGFEIVFATVNVYTDSTCSEILFARIEESAKEIVEDGFPRLYEVSSATAIMYEEANSSSKMLVVMTKGKGGIAKGVTYDTDGKAWYEVTLYNSGNTYNGYVQAESLDVGYSVPTSGDTATPTPTQAPSGGSGSATYSWYYVKYTVGSNEYTGYVLGDYLDFEDSVNAVVNKDRAAVYEEMYVTTQIQHYLDEGDEVRIVEEYKIGLESGSFMAKVNEFMEMVKVVPRMISSIFSFLPDWCLNVVGVVFAVVVIVFGLKLIL